MKPRQILFPLPTKRTLRSLRPSHDQLDDLPSVRLIDAPETEPPPKYVRSPQLTSYHQRTKKCASSPVVLSEPPQKKAKVTQYVACAYRVSHSL